MGLIIDTELNFPNHHTKMTAHVQNKLTHFRRIRCFINIKAAKLIYKCTILPIMEYADFVQDQGVSFINKAIQKLQNYGLSIVFNQHILPFQQRDSSETLHRKCCVFRLTYRRHLHLLQFAFKLKGQVDLLDNRDIPTRRHDGIHFNIPKSNHYKFPKNPYYKCMIEWNRLPPNISQLESREEFKSAIKVTIVNPYEKVLL